MVKRRFFTSLSEEAIHLDLVAVKKHTKRQTDPPRRARRGFKPRAYSKFQYSPPENLDSECVDIRHADGDLCCLHQIASVVLV